MLPAYYEESEVQLVRDLIKEYEHNIGAERKAALNSIFVLHELKAMLGASVLDEQPVPEAPEPPGSIDPKTMKIPF